MSITKRINGSYTIINKDSVLGTASNVTISTNTLYIDGNLVVGGNAAQVTRTDTAITDNLIILNKGETGAGVTLGISGVEIDRGSSANVQIRYNDSVGKHYWELTNDGTSYTQISSGTSLALANVKSDSSPTLGANLNLNGYTIYNASAGNVSISISTPYAGGTGLYSTTTSLGTHELILKRLALIYNTLL
jgi:hypothetical protein